MAFGTEWRVGYDEVHQELGARGGVGAEILDESLDDREPVVAQELVLGHGAIVSAMDP
jgi:hypothetical protein